MTAPEGSIDVLDPRFPIRLAQPPAIFEQLLALRPDRPAAAGLTQRAAADPGHQERYVTAAPEPRFVPALAHDDTSVDGLPRDWYRDSFPREGMPQPDGTDTFLVGYSQAEAEERAAAERRPWQRVRGAVRRLGGAR